MDPKNDSMQQGQGNPSLHAVEKRVQADESTLHFTVAFLPFGGVTRQFGCILFIQFQLQPRLVRFDCFRAKV